MDRVEACPVSRLSSFNVTGVKNVRPPSIFDAEVFSLEIGNTACLGAALRAFHADRRAQGDPIPWKEVVRKLTEPDPGSRVVPILGNVAVYAELKKRYAAIEEAAIEAGR